MNQVSKLKELRGLGYFDRSTLSQFVDVSPNSLNADIKRWLKKGLLVKLKNGLYVTGSFVERHAGSDGYSEFVANRLYEPSYLSCEYVLQKHNVLTDAVFAFTSVTLKTKRVFENALGRFIYRNISEKLFTGYEIVDRDGFQIKVAGRAKALFDYLYLRFYRKKAISADDLRSLRFDLGDYSREDFLEFSKYCGLTGVAKFRTLPDTIRGL